MNEINVAKTYQVKVSSGPGCAWRYSYVRTLKAAVKKIAWSEINRKYSEHLQVGSNIEYRGMKCECADKDWREGDEFFYHHDQCELHDRWPGIGYFARIAERYQRLLLVKYDNFPALSRDA